jgi:hypothetical protein
MGLNLLEAISFSIFPSASRRAGRAKSAALVDEQRGNEGRPQWPPNPRRRAESRGTSDREYPLPQK